jgi:hypothetical protein
MRRGGKWDVGEIGEDDKTERGVVEAGGKGRDLSQQRFKN